MTMKKMMLMLLLPLLIIASGVFYLQDSEPAKQSTTSVAVSIPRDDVPPRRVPARASRERKLTSPSPRATLPTRTVTQSSRKDLTQNSKWDRLAVCESGGNWTANTGNGYYGGIQFSLSSWRAVGGSGYPHNASRTEQINRGEKLRRLQGWGAWPACSRKLGFR